MTVRVLLTCEGPTDERWLRAVLPRWLVVTGLETDGTVGDALEFVGPDDAHSYLQRKSVPSRARAAGLKSFRSGEAGQTRLQLQLVRLTAKARRIDATVLLRDLDDEPGRAEVIAVERTGVDCGPLAVGTPLECREAWQVCGVSPTVTGVEPARATLQRACRFDPLAAPHRLSHKQEHPRSAKQVWDQLAEHVSSDESVDHLLTRLDETTGAFAESRARAFFAELDTHVRPLFGGSGASGGGASRGR